MNFIEEFCRKYEARVGPSSQPWRRTKPVPYDVWREDPDVFKTVEHQDVPMVEITMPEDRFRALMEHDHWLANAGLRCDTNFFNNYVMRVGNMIVDHERECRLRSEHVALQKAWEQYQIMLRMVDDGRN